MVAINGEGMERSIVVQVQRRKQRHRDKLPMLLDIEVEGRNGLQGEGKGQDPNPSPIGSSHQGSDSLLYAYEGFHSKLTTFELWGQSSQRGWQSW